MMSDQIYKFTVGDFNCISIQDEDGVQPATQFFPNVPEDELKQSLEADGLMGMVMSLPYHLTVC